MSGKLTAPPDWDPAFATGDEKVDGYRQKALAALAGVHELAEEGLKGKKLAALEADALEYIDSCLKYEELWQRSTRPADYPLRAAKLAKWREGSRKLVGKEEFWTFAARWWRDYLP